LKNIRIGTRKSPLALWQAEDVRQRLLQAHPGIEVELVTMTTQGDKILDTPLAKVGGKGLFVKELENALLEGRTDIAVHSMKDVTVELPPGLHIPVICEREEPRDAFVSNQYADIHSLPSGARLGTSSLRRQCQLAQQLPHLNIISLRGNVNTRLAKLDAGEFDAIILATAGLKRLGFDSRITQILPIDICLPAVGQGAVGIECRQDDEDTHCLIASLNHIPTQQRVTAERAMNKALNGGCQVPIAGYAEIKDQQLMMRGLVGQPDGNKVLKHHLSGHIKDAEQLGTQLANVLLSMGAGEILKQVYANA